MRATPFRRVYYVWVLFWGILMTAISTSGSVCTHLLFDRPEWFRPWAIFWGKSMFLGMGIRVRTIMDTALDPDQPYVFAMNHQNLLDIPVAAVAVPCPFGFVAKSELARVPILGSAIRHSPSVFLDRSTARKSLASMQAAGRTIREGLSVIIFPEGARSFRRELLEFKKGAFLLALEAGVPLVPVTIIDGFDVIDESRKVARPGVIHVHIGMPIHVEGKSRRELTGLMEEVADGMRAQLGY